MTSLDVLKEAHRAIHQHTSVACIFPVRALGNPSEAVRESQELGSISNCQSFTHRTKADSVFILHANFHSLLGDGCGHVGHANIRDGGVAGPVNEEAGVPNAD
ncbi:uncharacterized protein CELE_F58D2.4 [Caenorhabditis elegans]|uniref:Uncharacterized protein n=1 Tax=Caenorhabditis elegans TaxID=6239 RepID=C1P649_CAEEL|nr:Uncharacterized protein CELE_F58D2.4 [Caenorhabditis elegans]CAX65061.2 Uncharacterized protein CELE_F58D2.4 [Caenorhabditis elegans]|eukprot:NP_001255706.1 Uncharacterized protein CELE_F58D2.4 [Caenorhabditis elegans]